MTLQELQKIKRKFGYSKEYNDALVAFIHTSVTQRKDGRPMIKVGHANFQEVEHPDELRWKEEQAFEDRMIRESNAN